MIRAAAVVLAATLAAPALAGVHVVGARGGQCHVDYDADVGYDGDDLVFEVDDRVVARISPDFALQVDGRPVALTPEQQFSVAQYRAGYDGLVAEAREIGLAGARLGTRAAFSALGALFRGEMEEFEAEIEAEAAKLEVHAESLCALAESLREQHAALADEVPEFGRVVPL